MSDLTYGETKNCAGCRYWSEMIAQSVGGGPVTAMCLAPTEKAQYTPPWHSCSAWASGELGAVDDPGDDPSRYESEADAEPGQEQP